MTKTPIFQRFAVTVMLVSTIGCRISAPAPQSGTGAIEVVQTYYDALKAQNWDAAYECVSPDAKKLFSRADFHARAQRYFRTYGLAERNVVIRSCDEQAGKAIAQINLTETKRTSRHRIRDGVVLLNTGNGWGIALSNNFGSQ